VENAHGKAPLCRAPENMRTAKIETHGNHRFSRSERNSSSAFFEISAINECLGVEEGVHTLACTTMEPSFTLL
jgi:hypothetical protein